MTVSSETSKSGPYTGNGVTTVFNYGFKIVDKTHIKVVRTASGVDTVLTVDVDYTVAGVGNDAGGQITASVAPTAAQSITLLRDVPFVQETDLENQGAYYAETVENAFDLAVMRDQQLMERLDRTLEIPASGSGPLSFPLPEAGRVVGWADDGETLRNYDNPAVAEETAVDAAATATNERVAAEAARDAAEAARDSALQVADPISFSTDQNLTAAQQAVARGNTAAIGLPDVGGVYPGPNGVAVVKATSPQEARAALGMVEQRIITTADGGILINNADNIWPGTINHVQLTTAGYKAYFDISSARPGGVPYVVHNDSNSDRAWCEIDSGPDSFIRGSGVVATDFATRVVKIYSGEMAIVMAPTGGRKHVYKIANDGWTVTTNYRYRRLIDGTIEAIYTYAGSINATSDSSLLSFPTAFNLDNATLVSAVWDAKTSDGAGPAPPAYPPSVSKKGTAHSLSAYQFKAYNPNAATATHPSRYHFVGVTD